MADYSKSRKGSRSSTPANAIDAQDLNRIEPIVTPEQLRERFLWGIRLSSDVIDPVTRRAQVITDPMLKDVILRAIADVEADTGVDIFPVQRAENVPFDRNTFQQWGYIRLEHSPVLTVDAIAIKPGNDQAIYEVPLEWVSTANYHIGQLNFVPIMPSNSNDYSLSPAGNGGGAVFLQLLGGMHFIPVFWEVQYTSGFYDGAVPRIANELIGIYAARKVLSMLAATIVSTSVSLGLDGMSQSRSGPGPNRFAVRMKELEDDRKRLVGKFRAFYGKKFVMTNI